MEKLNPKSVGSEGGGGAAGNGGFYLEAKARIWP